MMGVVCDAENKPLIYDATSKDFAIREGIVISKNMKVFETVHERLEEKTGHRLPHFHKKTLNEAAEYRRLRDAERASR